MAGSEAAHRAPYADDAPRELSDEELSFLSGYTDERDLPALRQHVLSVWHDVKAKARLAPCAHAFVLQLDSWRMASLWQGRSVQGFAKVHIPLALRLSSLSGAWASTQQDEHPTQCTKSTCKPPHFNKIAC